MSRILENVHAAAKRLHDRGRLNDVTMREFDSLCLPPQPGVTASREASRPGCSTLSSTMASVRSRRSEEGR